MSPRFASPPNHKNFNEQVWDVVRRIPKGKVAAYGQIGLMIAPPAGMDPQSYLAFAARWVGGALAQCPDDVPWQRVINAQGKISGRPGADLQRSLLEAEGIVFDAKGKVDLNIFGWEG
jgi:methylated-DNA-protein-cysteine methyltransferase-like protein